ncbi:MAG: DMT family transporter [candidate division WOR-3 bacterium]
MSYNKKKSYFYGILSVLIWSTVASAFKLTLKYLDFLYLLFVSSLTALTILFFILILQKKTKFFKNLKTNDYIRSLILGFLNPFLYYTVLFKAYSLLKAQEAQPLNYTWAIVLSILSVIILKQKIKIWHFIGLIIGFIGVFIIATEGKIKELNFKNPFGVFLALSSSIIWAIYWIYNLKDKKDEVLKLFLNFLFGFPFILITYLIFSTKTYSLKGILGSIYVGLFEMGITFIFWLKAIKYAERTSDISILIYFSPFLSLLFIRMFVGEKILISTIIGLLFIIGGVLIQKYDEIKEIFKRN